MYRAYVSGVSYYSGKLEAYLRYAEIAHERIEINSRLLREVILPATGVMKVPVMQCPDGRWLKDSTPMIRWLDQQHGSPSIYPTDPAARFIALLVEDYADEWLWRPAMYYRWNFADSHRLLRARLGHDLAAGTAYNAWALGWIMRWRQYLIYVRGDGVRRDNQREIESLYSRSLQQLGALLATRPYLLGQRPTIVDFAFFASMFRHFALDPHSARIMVDTAPAVYAWVARVWNARASGDGVGSLGDFGDPAWHAVFGEIGRDYLAYLDANAAAYARGDKRFDLGLGAHCYPRMPVVRYRVACREQLLNAWQVLSKQQQDVARASVQASGIGEWLAGAAPIPSGLDAEFVMPLAQRYPPARGWYGFKLLKGTPWDLPAPPVR